MYEITDKPTVCVDFNGVIDAYQGWVKGGNGTEYPPHDGVQMFLEELKKTYKVIIFTTIDSALVWEWLTKYNLSHSVDDVTNSKPPAKAYIDDRTIQFNGDYQEVLDKLQSFKAYWEK